MTGNHHFSILRSELTAYLEELEAIVDDCLSFKQSLLDDIEATDLRVYGSFLHDFYTCIERVFTKVALDLDGELPASGSWHSSLLERMTIPVDTVRDKVIDESLAATLRDFLGFRHVFRSVYGSKLKQDRIEALVSKLDETRTEFVLQARAFLQFLERVE